MEIVLVEDDDDDAERMMRFLKRNFSNPIRYFQDGEAAVNFLLFETDRTPKLILLDVILPFIDGPEIFRLIRAEPKARNLSVMFLITSLDSKKYIESLGLHPDGYIKKPRENSLPMRINT
jgi:DNA-binding response OmpR family regulator